MHRNRGDAGTTDRAPAQGENHSDLTAALTAEPGSPTLASRFLRPTKVPMSLSLRQIEVFRAIMVCGTFTDAARMLNISQPAVSRVVGHAENRLGFKLFRRARGSLSPTLEARALYPDVERIFRELAALQRFAGDLGAGRTGLLRVAASSALGFSVLPNAINAFRADWPGVKVVSHWLPAPQMADLVLAHEIDLGLT